MRDGLQAGRVMDYRPDLQGLRALAILAVVAAHAGLPHLEGGFVGVDVFFVLSGYLITGMLLRELRLQGTLDLAAFYARRLRRLLPALLFMLACLMPCRPRSTGFMSFAPLRSFRLTDRPALPAWTGNPQSAC